MSEFDKIPQNEQQRYLDMMPQYGSAPDEEFRVGFGRRLGAWIIDWLLISVVTAIITNVLGIGNSSVDFSFEMFMSDPEGAEALMYTMLRETAPLSLVVGFLYFVTEFLFAASPGKLILGIQIGKADRTYADMKTLVVRFLAKHFDYAFMLLFIVLGTKIYFQLSGLYIMIILIGSLWVFSYKRMALHDKIAGTAIFYRDEFKKEQASL